MLKKGAERQRGQAPEIDGAFGCVVEDWGALLKVHGPAAGSSFVKWYNRAGMEIALISHFPNRQTINLATELRTPNLIPHALFCPLIGYEAA